MKVLTLFWSIWCCAFHPPKVSVFPQQAYEANDAQTSLKKLKLICKLTEKKKSLLHQRATMASEGISRDLSITAYLIQNCEKLWGIHLSNLRESYSVSKTWNLQLKGTAKGKESREILLTESRSKASTVTHKGKTVLWKNDVSCG